MKNSIVKNVTVTRWQARLEVPFRTAFGQHDILDNVLLKVELRDGTCGFGEAAVAFHITGETVEQTLENLQQAARTLIGHNVSNYLRISAEYAEKFKTNSCALAAVEMAVLDSFTRLRRIPLWKFFGRKLRPVKTDMTVVLGTLEEAKKWARAIYKRGIRAVKIKIGGNPDEDFKRVLGVAKEIKGRDIYLDANQGFSADEALQFLKRILNAGVKPILIEQPVPKEDWEGLAKVTRESGIMVVADESVSTISDARRVIREKCAGAINIKFMKFGILRALEIAKLAKKSNLKLMMGGMMETPLATTASAHFAGGLGGFEYIDLDAPFFISERIVKKSYLKQNGVYDLQNIRAGIGIEPILKDCSA